MTVHSHSEAPETPPPAGEGPLVLDIGGDVGALIVYATGQDVGNEIHLQPAGDPAARTHNVVRERRVGGQALYAAVFPALTAGAYLVVPPPGLVGALVRIVGGRVAEVPWGRPPGVLGHDLPASTPLTLEPKSSVTYEATRGDRHDR
jgi:hypothetical protein